MVAEPGARHVNPGVGLGAGRSGELVRHVDVVFARCVPIIDKRARQGIAEERVGGRPRGRSRQREACVAAVAIFEPVLLESLLRDRRRPGPAAIGRARDPDRDPARSHAFRRRRAVNLCFVDHDEVSGRQGRILHHRTGGSVLLIEVGHARVGAASASRVSRPEHGTAVLVIPETRREDEVPEIGTLQHESVAIVGVADLVGHRHEEIMQARLSARKRSESQRGERLAWLEEQIGDLEKLAPRPGEWGQLRSEREPRPRCATARN